MVANLDTANAILKEDYAIKGVEEVMYTDRPLLGLLEKFTAWEGANDGTRGLRVPIGFAPGGGVSGSFPVGQANGSRNAAKLNAFILTSVKAYGFAQIDNETMERSAEDKGAFLDVARYEIDQLINAMSNRLHQNLFGDGTGVIGAIANSSFSTSICVLTNPDDTVHIEIGDELTSAQTAGSSARALGSNGHGWYVIAVDRDKGTFTAGTAAGAPVNLSDSADGIPTAANLDVLFHRGDQNSVVVGLEGWNPQVAPTNGDDWFTVDRSQDTVRLSGSRFDGTSFGIDEALVRAGNTVCKQGGQVKEAFMNFKHFSDLVGAISSKVEYQRVGPEDSAEVGYETISVIGAKGSIRVIPDHACPVNRVFMTNLSDLQLASVGEAIHVNDKDGNPLLRVQNADAVEARYVSYANLLNRNPRNQMNILVSI